MKKAILASIAVVVVVAGISSYTSTMESATEPLSIFLTPWPPYGIAYVAQEKGIFEKNQVDVKLSLLDESQSLLHFKHEFNVDGSFEVLADTIIINSNHDRVQYVYSVDESGEADVVISKLNSIKELHGKNIGIWEFGGFSHLFLLALLEKNGMNENDVFFIEINPGHIVEALNDGIIDAGHTFNEENIKLAKSFGYGIIATERDTPGLITDGIMFKLQTITKRHDDVFNFIKSFHEAQEYCEFNLDECNKIIAKHLNQDEENVRLGLEQVDLKNLEDNLKLLSYDNKDSLYTSGEFIITKLRQSNQLSYSPDIYDVINPDFVNELAGIKNP